MDLASHVVLWYGSVLDILSQDAELYIFLKVIAAVTFGEVIV